MNMFQKTIAKYMIKRKLNLRMD